MTAPGGTVGREVQARGPERGTVWRTHKKPVAIRAELYYNFCCTRKSGKKYGI